MKASSIQVGKTYRFKRGPNRRIISIENGWVTSITDDAYRFQMEMRRDRFEFGMVECIEELSSDACRD